MKILTPISSETSGYLVVFGVLTMLLGLIGYLTHPDNVMLALIFGGILGVLMIWCGFLGFRGHRWSRVAAFVAAGLLGLVCIWRATLGWHAVATGENEKAFVALVITVMLAVSVFLTWLLVREGKSTDATKAAQKKT